MVSCIRGIVMKCKKPNLHLPQFEGRYNCLHCIRDDKNEMDRILQNKSVNRTESPND